MAHQTRPSVPPAARHAAREAAAPGAVTLPVARLPRALVVLCLALAAVLSLELGPLASRALAQPPREVTVADEAEVLNDDPLADRLREVDFREDVHLVALTLDLTRYGGSANSDIGLNDAVLAYARQKHPEWLSPEGTKWADGLVIIAIDPSHRKLGTYAGEDVKLADDDFQSVQDAMRDPARNAAWDDAMVEGAQKYASILGRPWYLNPALLVVVVVAAAAAVLAVLGSIIALLRTRATARRRVDEALPRYDDVMLHYAETELAAKTIPAQSAYGAPVLRDYEEFQRAAAQTTRLREQLPATRGALWGATPSTSRLAREFARSTEQIDDMDDEIVAANALLNKDNGWRDAWEREAQPLRDSIAEVDPAIRRHAELADSPTARDLRATAAEAASRLEDVTRDLENGEMAPESALGALDEMTGRLSLASTQHRDAIIGRTARDQREAEIMQRATGTTDLERRYGSIRSRRRFYEPDAYGMGWSLSPVIWLSSWNTAAASQVHEYRHPPSSSTSSSSGYSSASSGGFSGAGSSSGF